MMLDLHWRRALQGDRGGAHVEGRPRVCLHSVQVGIDQRRVQLELIEVNSCCCWELQLSTASWPMLSPPPGFGLLALGMLSSAKIAQGRCKVRTVHARRFMSTALWDG